MHDEPEGRDRAPRDRDQSEDDRERYSSGRPYGDRENAWRHERHREYADRYGVSHGPREDRERDSGPGRPPSYGTYPSGSFTERSFGPSQGRQWSGESWRVPGPFSGRGPRGYQRSDARICEEVNDRLTLHGLIDATDVEVHVERGEVTLEGFVDSRDAKHAAEDCAEQVAGVHDVHNRLRIRPGGDTRTPSHPQTAGPDPAGPGSRSRTT